jgi:hypothetical protein
LYRSSIEGIAVHPREDLDCIAPDLTLAKSTRPQIYYVKLGIWLGHPSVQYDNFLPTPTHTAERGNFVELDATDLDLKPAFGSGHAWD